MLHGIRRRPQMLRGQNNIGAIREGRMRRGIDNNGKMQETESQRCAEWMTEGPNKKSIGEIAGNLMRSVMMRDAGE